jgi:alanine racemase
MIKAGAYGHGAVWAAKALGGMPGLYGFGVATLEEGEELRQAKVSAPILVFSGITPFSETRAERCAKLGLTPVISGAEDWKFFSRSRFLEKIPYELKFDTGMNRLGLPPSFATELAAFFERQPKARPRGVMSHLAMAEKPDSVLSRRQLEAFASVRAALSTSLSGRSVFHLGNSGAIWNARAWRLAELTDVVRPGLSLYGVPPWPGAKAQGLKLVMNIDACVIAVKSLRAGDTVGYGAHYTCTGTTGRVAILSMGYADGLLRTLSNQGRALVGAFPTRFAGRISMDLSAVELPPEAETRVGDPVRVLGEGIDPWEQARLAGTIPYELLTSVSARVERKHVR